MQKGVFFSDSWISLGWATVLVAMRMTVAKKGFNTVLLFKFSIVDTRIIWSLKESSYVAASYEVAFTMSTLQLCG